MLGQLSHCHGRFAALSRACALAALCAAGASCAQAQVADARQPAEVAAEAASGTAAAPENEDALRWDWRWLGWDGVYFEATAKTTLDAQQPWLRFDQVRLAGTVGGRIEVDGAAFDSSDSLAGFDSGFELRRARIRIKGDALLVVPFRYKVEFGYVPGRFNMTDFYVAVPEVPVLGTVQVGFFQPSMGLQVLMSSWDIGLMEPAAALQAIAPGDSAGVSVGNGWGGGRGTWSLGVYSSAGSLDEYGSAIKDMGTVIGRLSWLARDDQADGGALVHLAVSGNLQGSNGGQVRYRSRPESYVAPYVIDTGTLSTDRAATLGLEAAWIAADRYAQAEWLFTGVRQTGAESLRFGGGYVQIGWFPTGEQRPYDRASGTFGRPRPLRNFGFGPSSGWGALELAARASYTDLSDGAVTGGRLALLMGGLTWNPQEQLAWRLNVGAGRVAGGATPGRLLIAQMRFGVDF